VGRASGLEVAAGTHRGLVRGRNEDAVAVGRTFLHDTSPSVHREFIARPAVDFLLRAALAAGGDDNASVVVARAGSQHSWLAPGQRVGCRSTAFPGDGYNRSSG
jgi:serine/threonine protein phosphatase PrpC